MWLFSDGFMKLLDHVLFGLYIVIIELRVIPIFSTLFYSSRSRRFPLLAIVFLLFQADLIHCSTH